MAEKTIVKRFEHENQGLQKEIYIQPDHIIGDHDEGTSVDDLEVHQEEIGDEDSGSKWEEDDERGTG